VITTDWGVFNEAVIHGKTGFRCRTLDHFLFAADRINKMDNEKRKLVARNCHEWIAKNYSLERVGLMYEEYFNLVYDVYTGRGWMEKNPQRMQLDWLKKYYPENINNPAAEI
jgi:hypothetical protein